MVNPKRLIINTAIRCGKRWIAKVCIPITRIKAYKRVIVQPERRTFGTFSLRPVRLNSEAISSIGHTVHHNLPKRTLEMMIAGHQKHQTIRFARFVFLNVRRNCRSSVVTDHPNMIRSKNTVNARTWKRTGIHLLFKKSIKHDLPFFLWRKIIFALWYFYFLIYIIASR